MEDLFAAVKATDFGDVASIGRIENTYPTLHFEGTSIREAEYITVMFEAFKIDIINMIVGMTAVMELYWILDIKYSDYNKNILAHLEYFCGLETPL
ncbi:hypothetical protein HPB52_006186 [Rhipicephalus sanguineus]|uniref:Uncharacterized protein n=1 Tax=Rhipicephalus sanguineus TaxID=34632 RepID=A0A9D4QCP1_RHISA|nr:hypothetical protein HPB52_006186 [Rhipicephalus sanguineus]